MSLAKFRRTAATLAAVLVTGLVPAAMLSAAPASASAPNTAPVCNSGGVTVNPYGSTFQFNAISAFKGVYGTTCGAGAATVNYNNNNNPVPPGAGSGKCINYMTTFAPDTVDGYGFTPFCGSDAGLTSQQWAAANSPTSPGGKPGVINQFPVAVGAVAIPYNVTGCVSPLVLKSSDLSNIFSGTWTQWSQVPGCSASTQSITRVVRNASSGTTCIFKTYLDKRNPQTWAALNANSGCTSTSWPSGSSPIVFGNGNPGVASAVSTTAGAVGYVDLSEVLTDGLGLPYAHVQTAPEEVAGGSESPLAADGTSANCNTTGAVLPPTTHSPGWDQVAVSDGAQGYPICGYTYDFMFTNNPFPAGAVSQAQIDAAVDYLLVATSNAGQASLAAAHYAPIGSQAQAEDQAGLALIQT